MATAASVIIELSANVARFVSGMDKATESLNGLKKSVATIQYAAMLQLGQAAIRGAEQIYEFGRSMAAFGSNVERTATTLGMSITEFQQLSYSAKMADVETSQFSLGMRGLVKAMEEARKGTGDGATAFDAMKIKVLDADNKTKSIKTVLEEMATKFPKWADGPNKMALGYALFGRAAEAMIPWMNAGAEAMRKDAEMADRLGITQEEYIKRLADSETAFKNFETGLIGLKIQLTPLVELMAQMVKNTTDWFSVLGLIDETGLQSQIDQVKELFILKKTLNYAESEGASPDFINKVKSQIKAIQDAWRTSSKTLDKKEPAPLLIDTEAVKKQQEKITAFMDKLRTLEISQIRDETNRELEEEKLKRKKLLAEAEELKLGKLNILILSDEAEQRIMAKGIERERKLFEERNIDALKFAKDMVQIEWNADSEYTKIELERIEKSISLAVNEATKKAAIFNKSANEEIEILKGFREKEENIIGISEAKITKIKQDAKDAELALWATGIDERQNALDELSRIEFSNMQEGISITKDLATEYYTLTNNIQGLVAIQKEETAELLRRANILKLSDVAKGQIELIGKNKELQIQLAPLKSFATSLSDTWGNMFTNMANSTESMADRVRNAFTSMIDSIIQQLAKLMMNLAMFGSMDTKGVGGLVGLLGGMFKSGLSAGNTPGTGTGGGYMDYAEGGIFTRSTIARIGEAGPEAVIPLKNGAVPVQGGGGNQYTIYNINALDPQSWSEFVRKNPGPLYREMHKDSRAGGAMGKL